MSKEDVRKHIREIQKKKIGFVESEDGQSSIGYFMRLNSDPAHFVWELIQNAEDVDATEITFELHQDRLHVRHNGTLFNHDNVEAICGVLKTNKRLDEGKIGKFGAGFKTVFAYTDAPAIYSGDYTFRITQLVYPEYIPQDQVLKVPLGETLFVLPFRTPAIAVKDISKKLRSLSTQALMFLKHIEKITVNVDGVPRVIQRTVKESVSNAKNTLFEHIVITDSNRDKEYYRFTLSGILLKDTNEKGENTDVKNQAVMIAYRRDASGKIVPISKSGDINKYFVFFPTEVETHLEFLVHAPFKTTLNRETFYTESPVNDTLYNKIIELVIISIHYLIEKNIVDAEFYNQIILPGGAVLPKEFPYDLLIKRLILELGKGSAIIPVYGGEYSNFADILIEGYKYTEKDVVKKHFSVNDIAAHIPAFKNRKYWDSGFYGTNFYKILNLAKEEYHPGENEISLKLLLSYLTPYWMKMMDIKTLINFYHIFASEDHKETRNFSEIGFEKIRVVPLVRTPDGEQLPPNKVYWRVADIHPALMTDSFCAYFLHELLQIPGYDRSCEIKDILFSRYSGDVVNVPEDVHLTDMEAVLSALNSGIISSSSLVDLQLILGVNAKTGHRKWCKPSEVFLSPINGGDEDTAVLLDGVSDVYFTHKIYEKFGDRLEQLDLRSPLHIEIASNQSLCGQYVEQQIRDVAEFRKCPLYLYPKENFKPNVSLPYLKEIFASSFNAKKALALYHLLSKTPQYIKGTVEWSTSKVKSASKSVRQGTMEVFSELGYSLKIKPWIYTKENCGRFSHQVSATTVHPGYLQDPALLELYGVAGVSSKKLSSWIPPDENIPKEMRELIDATSHYSSEEIKEVLENLHRPQSVKSIFASLLEQNNNGVVAEIDEEDDGFDPTPIGNQDAREKKLDQRFDDEISHKVKKIADAKDPENLLDNPRARKLLELAKGDDKKFLYTLGSALGTGLVDFACEDIPTAAKERAFLEQEYQGRCQICSKRIPKALKPGSKQFPYHYIARNVIRTRDIDAIFRDTEVIDGWNSLSLCPMCAAKYLYCSKDLSTFADQVLDLKINPQVRAIYEIKIKLNGKTETIHYMPKHILALQRALKYFKAHEEKE